MASSEEPPLPSSNPEGERIPERSTGKKGKGKQQRKEELLPYRNRKVSVTYLFSRGEAKHELAPPDLVWGKVMGYPWWPGQILDPSYASRKALNRRKKNKLLVAYFGDKTFAWCSPSNLKPLLPYFGDLENRSTTNAFLNAVRAVATQAAARAEVSMSTTTDPDTQFQSLENAGIRKGVAIPTAPDATFGPSSFSPVEFVRYVGALATCPMGAFGALDLAVVRAHLMAYRRSQGFAGLCSFYVGKGLEEDDGVTHKSSGSEERLDSIPMDENRIADVVSRKMGPPSGDRKEFGSSEKRNGEKVYGRKGKKSGFESGRKEKVSSRKGKKMGTKRKKIATPPDVDGGGGEEEEEEAIRRERKYTRKEACEGEDKRLRKRDLGRKRKKEVEAIPSSVGQRKRKKVVEAMPSSVGEGKEEDFESEKSELMDELVKKSPPSATYKSFKVGEFIRRVATKLTNSSSILKNNGVTSQNREVEDKSLVSSSSDEKKACEESKQEFRKEKGGSDEGDEPPGEIKYSRRNKV